MAFEKDLQTKKADALIAYKAAKNDFLLQITKIIDTTGVNDD